MRKNQQYPFARRFQVSTFNTQCNRCDTGIRMPSRVYSTASPECQPRPIGSLVHSKRGIIISGQGTPRIRVFMLSTFYFGKNICCGPSIIAGTVLPGRWTLRYRPARQHLPKQHWQSCSKQNPDTENPSLLVFQVFPNPAQIRPN